MAAPDLPTNFTLGNTSQAVDGVGSLFTYANYASNGAFGIGLLVLIFLMSFIAGSVAGMRKSFGPAAFVTFIFSVYLARIDVVSPIAPFVLISLTIVGFFLGRGEAGSY